MPPVNELTAMAGGPSSPAAFSGASPAKAEAHREQALRALVSARSRLLSILERVPTEALTRQHSPLMSPIVWDLAHIANYEEQWLLRALGEPGLTSAAFDRIYDAFEHPRATRAQLPLLSVREARAYLAAVRERVLDKLERVELSVGALLDRGFVYGMVAQHEQQHLETVLATLALMTDFPAGLTPTPSGPFAAVDPQEEIFIPGGEAVIGSEAPWVYDNERPEHRVVLAPYFLGKHPVTNGRYLEFIEDGGYSNPRWWSAEGYAFARRERLEAPLYWERRGSTWLRRRFDELAEIAPHEPVQHVSAFEADAFARWAGRRLPTELEWEHAARAGGQRTWPWGEGAAEAVHANLAGASLGPLPIGSHPAGASVHGVMGMIGDVWEWTSSAFAPWPGFRAFPYPEYSEVFWGGDYRVLRGGSWATAPVACRNSFRNWDFPLRRQIFSGFRLARSAEPRIEEE